MVCLSAPLRKHQPLCGVLSSKVWSLDLDIVVVPCCWFELFEFRRLCVYQGKESWFCPCGDLFTFNPVDKVRIPVIFAFFRDTSLVVAAFVSTLGSWSVTYRTSRCVRGHSRKQKIVCLVVQGLSCFVVAWIHPNLDGSHRAKAEQSCDRRSF